MKIARTCLALLALQSAGSLLAHSALANELELYVDTQTKQIFSEPAEGRIPLGKFRAVDPQQKPAPVAEINRKEILAEVDKKFAEITKAQSSGLKIRGYVQNRYSTIVDGDKGIDLWTDRSVGDSNSLSNNVDNFLIRRGRLVLSGDIGDRFSYYIQPDFASAAGTGNNNFMQLRDAYGDISIDKEKVHRFRVGQSKVPFGFENLQSSQNRIALDRADALNSAVRDERDLGVFYYYTPKDVQQLFSEISKAGLKHSGNYGQFALGLYNGQGSNRRDTNDGLHAVTRFTQPIKTESGQFYEFGIQGYTGKFVPTLGRFRNSATGGEVSVSNPMSDPRLRDGFDDQRLGVSAIMYPQPFGLQAEWNWGKSPGLDKTTQQIGDQNVQGGYVQAMYQIKPEGMGVMFPFLRLQYFDGFNKAEVNAPQNEVRDIELGVEWQINKEVELTTVFHRMNRSNLITGNRAGREDYAKFKSDVLRVQLQYNF